MKKKKVVNQWSRDLQELTFVHHLQTLVITTWLLTHLHQSKVNFLLFKFFHLLCFSFFPYYSQFISSSLHPSSMSRFLSPCPRHPETHFPQPYIPLPTFPSRNCVVFSIFLISFLSIFSIFSSFLLVLCPRHGRPAAPACHVTSHDSQEPLLHYSPLTADVFSGFLCRFWKIGLQHAKSM